MFRPLRELPRPGSKKWARSSAVEHLTFNQRVVGSNPAGLTNYFNELDPQLEMILHNGVSVGFHPRKETPSNAEAKSPDLTTLKTKRAHWEDVVQLRLAAKCYPMASLPA